MKTKEQVNTEGRAKMENLIFEFPKEKQMEDPRDTGFKCGCCGQFVKRYARPLNCNMALALIVLYKSGIRDFIHLEDLMSKKGYKRCGDASYLVHWRFLEKCKEKREDGSKRNGKYKITSLGLMFVENKIKARAKCYIFNNKSEGLIGEEITIMDALNDKFNYNTLMNS